MFSEHLGYSLVSLMNFSEFLDIIFFLSSGIVIRCVRDYLTLSHSSWVFYFIHSVFLFVFQFEWFLLIYIQSHCFFLQLCWIYWWASRMHSSSITRLFISNTLFDSSVYSSLMKFSICSCILFTFSTEVFNIWIRVILTSLSLIVPISGSHLSLVLFITLSLDTLLFFPSLCVS